MARDEMASEAETDTSLLDRRSYLQLAGAAAASVATFSATGGASQSDDLLLQETFETEGYADHFTSAWMQGDYETLVSEPTKSGSNALEVSLPENNHYGIDATLDPVEAGMANSELTELYASYWVRFSEDFRAGSAVSKLPGPANVEPGGAKGGTSANGTNGWSARGGFRDAGSDGVQLSYYVYHMDAGGTYGDHFWATTVPSGQWVKIGQYIKLNSVSGGSANRDGELKMWVDDTLEIDRSGLRFTEDLSLGINYWYNIYFGGGSTSPQDQEVYLDSWALSTAGLPDLSSDSSTGTDTDEEETDTTDEPDHEGTLFELITDEGTATLDYEFTVEGSVEKHTSAGDFASEGNDHVTDNGDGTTTVTGAAGNGYGDSYFVDGTFVSIDIDESQWSLRYDGEDTSVQDLVSSNEEPVLPNELVIDGSNRPRMASTYSFEVSGEVQKNADLGSVNAFDEISDGSVSGRIVGGKDGFRFSGEITSFTLDGPATVSVRDNS